MTLKERFNALVNKVFDAKFVTRTGIKGNDLVLSSTTTGSVERQWFEARKVGHDQYQVFQMNQLAHTIMGMSRMSPGLVSCMALPTEKPIVIGQKNKFSLQEAKETLMVLESAMTRDKDFRMESAPSSVGTLKRYYK